MNTRIIRFLFGMSIASMIALVLLVLPVPVSSAPANTFDIYVDTPADEFDSSGSGSGCALREAIESAFNNVDFGGCYRLIYAGSTPPNIFVPSNTYSLTLPASGSDNNANGDLNIYKSMTISATGAVTVTGDVGWSDRIFHVVTGTVTMKGLVIRRGSECCNGGALRIESGQALTLNDSVVANNSGEGGAGVYNLGTLTLTGSTVFSNTTLFGSGGGIYNSGIATLNRVTLSNNRAGSVSGGGGAIFNSGGAVTLANVTLSGNEAEGGGGIYAAGGLATVTNATLSGNNAISGCFFCLTGGGGIYITGTAMLNLTNVTLSGNNATFGTGIYKYNGTVALTNTIMANGSENCNGFSGGSFNLSNDNTCNFGGGRDNVNVNLAPLANNGGPTLTHALLLGSPAVDAGTNVGCPSTDQRGWHRPFGSTCDVGAYERGASLFLPLILR